MTDKELVLKYAPCLMADKLDPFPVKKIGCTVFRQSGRSLSFNRRIEISRGKAELAIEYAVAYDYDIQHLYELEHVWVYVGSDGAVCGCEGSWHGKVINEMLPSTDILHGGTHVCLYSQPGKHALLPNEACLYLFPKLMEACGELAGADGFAYPEKLYNDSLEITDEQQRQVEAYIKKTYAFTPSMEFEPVRFGSEIFTDWADLRAQIPQWMRAELRKILTN